MATPTATTPPSSPVVDVERAIATLVVAFSADPVVRWFLPDGPRYLATFPQLLRLVSDGARPTGTVDVLEGHVAAALWHQPGTTTDDDALAVLVERSTDPERLGDTFAFLEQLADHHPEVPHWYLGFIGVDPVLQGHGHGSRLLVRGLERCDEAGLPAYLEASSPRNRALYERHGFAAVAEVQVADSPPLWPMWRPAADTRRDA